MKKLVSAFVLLIISGCSEPYSVHLDYIPTPQLSHEIGNNSSITISVLDDRDNKFFGTKTAGPGIILVNEPLSLLKSSFNTALKASGYRAVGDSGIIYEISVRKFDVEWPIGAPVPVTAEIVLDISIKDKNGETVQMRRISERVQDWAGGGGPDAPPVAARVIQQCLTNVIERSVHTPSIIAAISTQKRAVASFVFGTGFSISKDGLIVTAYHVVKDAKTIKVYPTKNSFISAQLLHGDPMNDLAVLKIENTTPNFLQIAPMRSVKIGDRVFTLGFPVSSVLGQEAKYTEGVVSSLSGLKDASSYLQITVPVQPGNSGGALVNERGEVVGIITSSAAILPFIEESGTLPQNVNWAVKADYLRPLIELPKAEQKEFDREQLIEYVKKSTFFIETE